MDDHQAPRLIEALVLRFLRELSSGNGPLALESPRRDSSNAALVDGALRLGARNKRARFPSRRYAQLWAVLREAYVLARQGRFASQRQIYYSRPDVFASSRESDDAILEAAAVLRVPRHALGILGAPRGRVHGRLALRPGPEGEWLDCFAAPRAICSAALTTAPGQLGLRCAARGVLVVEKDTVFSRLARDGLAAALPLLLVTGCGYPDLATRALVARLHRELRLPVWGLADWNPDGLALLLTYRLGSARLGVEAHRHAVGALRWLPSCGSPGGGSSPGGGKPLTRRDRRRAADMLEAGLVDDEMAAALEQMLASGEKHDLEALEDLEGWVAEAAAVAVSRWGV